jgi:hypothetical protein
VAIPFCTTVYHEVTKTHEVHEGSLARKDVEYSRYGEVNDALMPDSSVGALSR